MINSVFVQYGLYILTWVVEIITVLYCIYKLFGEDQRKDIYIIGLIIVDVILVFLIWKKYIGEYSKVFLYLLLILYCKYQFKQNIKKTIVLCVIGVVISALLQLLGAFVGMSVSKIIKTEIILMLLINVVSYLMAIVVFEIKNVGEKIKNLKFELTKWKEIVVICGLVLIFMLVDYWYNGKTNQVYYVMSLVLCVYVCFSTVKLEKEKYKYEKKLLETELEKKYGDTYKELLEIVRINQHDFRNQISVLYSMHITAESLEELVENQRAYGAVLLEKGKYNSILTGCNNKILAGYIYSKCVEIENMNIILRHKIKVFEAECRLLLHEIIEVLGILLTNAIESVSSNETNRIIELSIEESREDITIIVSNADEKISLTKVEEMFEKGYSTKGEQRGLGLTRLKSMVEKVQAKLIVACQQKQEINMLEFKIIVPK